MTPEEAKQLKKGDKILVKAEVWSIHDDGDIQFGHLCKSLSGALHMVGDYVIPECVSLIPAKPKYDPCRLLRKGDRVQVKKRNGRCNGKNGEYLREAFCEVAEDEVPNERVRVYHNSSEYLLDPAYLELVTPVEELEPYRVDHNQYGWHVEKDGEILATYNDERHPHAKEAAEAERDRLNSEYRKEQA